MLLQAARCARIRSLASGTRWNLDRARLFSISAAAEAAELAPESLKPRRKEIFAKVKPSFLLKTPVAAKDPIQADRRSIQRQQSKLAAVPTFHDPDAAVYDSEELQHQGSELPEALVSVEAFCLARSVDLKALAMEPSLNAFPCRNHLVIKLDGSRSREDYTPIPGCLSNDRMIVVFQYGSVVLFNFDDLESSCSDDLEFIRLIKKHGKEVFAEPKKDNYRVLVIPGLDRWSRGGSDKIMVKKLDIEGIRIISLVLGQSIALDHYTRSIDEMLNTFGELNRHMELTGTFNMKRKALFKLVAAANAALADAILRLGLLERSDAAWQSARYDRIWEYMREDFEVDDRFESLEFKIGIIQHNVKFFLDILQNRKSDSLEWIIIFLIAGEICVSVYDILRGTGAI